jgi:hypothetical protein
VKARVTKFKSLPIALKEIEPFVRNGSHLLSGAPLKKFGGLRSREILANWLLCAVLNASEEDTSFTFTSDPQGGDGVIYNSATEHSWPTEHVMVPPKSKIGGDETIEDRIAMAVALKVENGSHYARGKTLIVLNESGAGLWYPDRALAKLPVYAFDDVWVIGLQDADNNKYKYTVTQLTLTPTPRATSWRVQIAETFDAWEVEGLS